MVSMTPSLDSSTLITEKIKVKNENQSTIKQLLQTLHQQDHYFDNDSNNFIYTIQN